jgi:hypothetical protein
MDTILQDGVLCTKTLHNGLGIAKLLIDGHDLGVLGCALRSHVVASLLSRWVECARKCASKINTAPARLASQRWSGGTAGNSGHLDVVIRRVGIRPIVKLRVAEFASADTLVDELLKLVGALDLGRTHRIASGFLLSQVLKIY